MNKLNNKVNNDTVLNNEPAGILEGSVKFKTYFKQLAIDITNSIIERLGIDFRLNLS